MKDRKREGGSNKEKSKNRQTRFVADASFCVVSTPTMADLRHQHAYPRTQSLEGMATAGYHWL
jgi:hypothetical protein